MTIHKRTILSSVFLFALMLLVTANASAKTTVDIKTNVNASSTSDNESTVRNYVEVNGETLVDEEKTTTGTNNSKIEVSVQNGKATVKKSVNGEETTVQVTPKVTNTGTPAASPSPKAESNEKEDEEAKNIIERVMKAIENFFAQLSSAFSPKENL